MTVEEGNEPDTFWTGVGGKQLYFTHSFTSVYIFLASNASGTFKAEEVFDFCQVWSLLPRSLLCRMTWM